ncbi:glycoside hydrolase family 3 protein [Cohnella yongneupensis]|uniref:beta-glucosidase n=1 Tax=Cohnella yongneupensis TaxID=425006 RepID=A0ABW0R5M6_9BACL
MPKNRKLSSIFFVSLSVLIAFAITITLYYALKERGSDYRSGKITEPTPSASQSTAEADQTAAYKDAMLPVSDRVDSLLSQMTLEEKIGQMVQAERKSISPADMTKYGVGSVLSGGGSAPSPNEPAAWMDMVDKFQQGALESRLGIPMIYGVDAVHGHNNVYGATLFPHNIALGATRDAELVREIGDATAEEMRATGILWDFAPCVCMPQDARWGRTYEGFSETSELTSALGAAFVSGLQGDLTRGNGLSGDHAIATLKHWVGDGSTEGGVDRGDAQLSDAELEAFIAPYRAGIQAGARTVMVSFSSLNGEKLHGSRRLITDVLKGELGFTGFVISDYNGIEEMEPGDFTLAVKNGVLAGIDMFMEPDNWRAFMKTLQALVDDGEVPQERIDDAVRRILTVKFEAGLFDKPFGDRALLAADVVGSDAHRALAREAVAKSAVLLKNEGGYLPLKPTIKKLTVVGSMADDIGGQSGGWSLSWQGQFGDSTPGTTIVQGIKQVVSPETEVVYDKDGTRISGGDAVVVVIGEEPYAEGLGDNKTLSLSERDIVLLDRAHASGLPTIVVLLSGRPLLIADELGKMEALVAAWLPGTEAGGIADVLFGVKPFGGKLSFTWPRTLDQLPTARAGKVVVDNPLFPYGYGLTTAP